MTPYRPGRVPVVLVHGTASSPARWADLVNELQADPRIAPRVQLWLFTYNTGLPVLYSAGLFREMLTKTVAELDPQGADPALRRMVLIGHSQGGLLAKLAVVDSGTRFWDNVSETPFEALHVSDQTRAILLRSMFMTPLPFVRRVVFVATPQRGSDVAGFLVGRLRWLVAWALTLPPSLIQVTGEVLVGSEDRRLRQQLRQGLPRSVDNMSPSNHGIKTLATLPIAPGVTVHSIIALKEGGSLGEGGDGVVSYRSAHLDEAASELIVQSGPFGAVPPGGDRGDPPDPAPAPRPGGFGHGRVSGEAHSDASCLRAAEVSRGMTARLVRIVGWGAVGLVLIGAGLWGSLALHYSDLAPARFREAWPARSRSWRCWRSVSVGAGAAAGHPGGLRRGVPRPPALLADAPALQRPGLGARGCAACPAQRSRATWSRSTTSGTSATARRRTSRLRTTTAPSTSGGSTRWTS